MGQNGEAVALEAAQRGDVMLEEGGLTLTSANVIYIVQAKRSSSNVEVMSDETISSHCNNRWALIQRSFWSCCAAMEARKDEAGDRLPQYSVLHAGE